MFLSYLPPSLRAKTVTYSFSGCQWMGLSVLSFPLGCTSQLWLGVGSVCRAGSSALSLTRCCSFMLSWASTPWHSSTSQECGPRSAPTINTTRAILSGTKGSPGNAQKCQPAPCSLYEGSWGAWLLTCVHRGSCQPGVHRQRQDLWRFAPLMTLCWPSTWGALWLSPWDIFCSVCFLGTLSGGLKQNFRHSWKACSVNCRE